MIQRKIQKIIEVFKHLDCKKVTFLIIRIFTLRYLEPVIIANASDSDNDSESEDEPEMQNNNNNNNNENNYIFPSSEQSHISLFEFTLVYLKMCNKLKLNKIARNLILNFIKTVLPTNNIIPNTYYKLIRFLNIPKPQNKIICETCYADLDAQPNNKLICNICKIEKNSNLQISKFDLKSQLHNVILRHKENIDKYKGLHFNLY